MRLWVAIKEPLTLKTQLTRDYTRSARMASSVLQMMMAIGLLTLILPCHADDEPSVSVPKQGTELPSFLSSLGTGILESAMEYVLSSMARSSGFSDGEDKPEKDS
ncbi:uncharacterized protein C5orf46 homolog [Notamacropus eugenii]|uniref:uncharacterized protein C5orf46 homolog n=1 Tax=Notamacropus eugenii TaxID=9315 RepID=UPI003B681879